jgi:phosphopantetheine adenylyltransferase
MQHLEVSGAVRPIYGSLTHIWVVRRQTVNEKWENINTIIKETKQQLIEKDEDTETFKNKRYDEERKFAVEEMKKAREKWLIKGRREKEQQKYHHKRKEAHKIISNKTETYVKNVIESIEGDQKHNNIRKMYQTVKQFKKGHQHKFSIIRNKN